jgi:glucose-6-phosphate 1-dehydrogenase
MLFVREDAVEAAWAIVDPLLANSTPLHRNKPGLNVSMPTLIVPIVRKQA